jgi:hypothetical protein
MVYCEQQDFQLLALTSWFSVSGYFYMSSSGSDNWLILDSWARRGARTKSVGAGKESRPGRDHRPLCQTRPWLSLSFPICKGPSNFNMLPSWDFYNTFNSTLVCAYMGLVLQKASLPRKVGLGEK